jgi:hypothetical protein
MSKVLERPNPAKYAWEQHTVVIAEAADAKK